MTDLPSHLRPTSRRRRPACKSPCLHLGLVLAASLLLGPVSFGDDVGDAQNAPTASGSGPLQLQIVVETLATTERPGAAEARHWEPAGRLNAGDELHYTIRVTNPGTGPVTDVVVTKRLPFGVHYIRNSAVGPACAVQFSIDGGATFSTPAQLGVGPNARRPARKIVPGDYTHV